MLLSVSICVRLSVCPFDRLVPPFFGAYNIPPFLHGQQTVVRLPIVHIPLVVGGWLLLFLIIFRVAFLSSLCLLLIAFDCGFILELLSLLLLMLLLWAADVCYCCCRLNPFWVSLPSHSTTLLCGLCGTILWRLITDLHCRLSGVLFVAIVTQFVLANIFWVFCINFFAEDLGLIKVMFFN